LGTVLEEYRGRVQSEREVKHALDTGFTKVLRQESRDVAPKVRRSGFSISISLPFMLLAITATAGFYRAVETTAGEKERNTMQTLLCAPVRSIEIVAGKFASIATITLIAAAANIASLGFTFGTVSRQLSGGSTLSLGQYLIVFAVLVPVTLLTSALFLAVGVFAKDFRDGQNLATPVMFLTMLPASVTMLPGVEANAYTVMIPCVNVALLIKALLVGEAKPDFIFLTLVSSAAYATLALLFAARVFERENLLTGGKDSFRGIFGFSDQRREITPSMAFATFCVVMVVLFYGTSLIKIDMRYVLVASQYLGMLLPPVAILLFLKLPLKQTLALRWPGWQPMVAAVLIGVALQKVMLIDRVDIPMLWIFFIASISPGLCEEVLFRGYIQGSFRKLGMVASIGLSAFLFAVAHASVYRMLPVLFLGLLLGWLYWQSKSTLPGMVAHALNNGVAISIMTVPAIRDYFVQHKLKYLPVSWSLAGLIVVAAGVWLATQGRVSESSKKEEA
jgi:sodium transport system permease protein